MESGTFPNRLGQLIPISTAWCSPNFGERRDGIKPGIVVLHYTAMKTAELALERLCSPEFEVSAHYLISETGDVFQLVSEDMRAWHAGAGDWADAGGDVNSHSIGIELANDGTVPFAAGQMCALELLLSDVMKRHGIAPERVIGHSDMAPLRKADPGSRFDWQRLAKLGLSVWPGKSEVESCDNFFNDCKAFGYRSDDPEALLTAFRLRFAPGAAGPVSLAEAGMAAALARLSG